MSIFKKHYGGSYESWEKKAKKILYKTDFCFFDINIWLMILETGLFSVRAAHLILGSRLIWLTTFFSSFYYFNFPFTLFLRFTFFFWNTDFIKGKGLMN